MVVEFGSELHKKLAEDHLRQKCAELGIKVAKSRNWATRNTHRKNPARRSLHLMREPANRFEVLEVEDVVEITPAQRKAWKRCRRKARKRNAERAQLTKNTRRSTVKVGALNCQGGVASKIAEYEDYAALHKYDVLALIDVGLKDGASLAAKDYKVFREEAGSGENGLHGVLFLVADHLAVAATVELNDTPNQLWLRITGTEGRRDLFVCAAYMPQEGAPLEDRKAAWNGMEAAAKHFDEKGDLVVVGDLNAKLLSAMSEREARYIGRYGQQGSRLDSGNGKYLYDVMESVGLVSLLGHSRPPAGVKEAAEAGFWYTRMDPITHTKNTLDYVLASERLEASKAWVDYEELNTDHSLVGAEIPCPRKVVRSRGRRKPRKRFRMEKMIQKSSKAADVEEAQSTRERYSKCLIEAFQGYDPEKSEGVDCACVAKCGCAAVADFIKRMHTACEEAVGSVVVGRKFSRSWWDDEVRAAVKARKTTHKAYRRASCDEERERLFKRYAAQRRACNKLIKKKKRVDWIRLMEDMEEAYRKDHKKLWQLVERFLPSGKKATMEPVRNQDGTMARTEEEIMEAWADHQEGLGTPKVHDLEDLSFACRVRAQVAGCKRITYKTEPGPLDAGFEQDEVKVGIEALQYHKAATEDGTTNPMFKCGGEVMENLLTRLFNFMAKRECVHPEWQKSTVVNLYKEGDRSQCGNYRGIALISCLGKLYLSLWARRLADFAESRLEDAQGGFRRYRSTVDQAIVFKETLRRRKRQGQDTFVCFIDFRKAFDTVWHDGLWKALWDQGVRGKAWRIVRSLYFSMQASVRLGDKTTREVKMSQGVRQGCPLSPTLFNYFINSLAKSLKESGLGLQIEGLDVGSLLYADDVVLAADSAEKLQGLIDLVDTFCRKWHMDINLKKSEVMVVGKHDPCTLCKRAEHAERDARVEHAKRVASGEVVGKYEEGEPRACALCSQWMCRGVRLKVVRKYKYLGIWFTSDLRWQTHIDVTLGKANKSTIGLGQVFRNGRIPARAKALVWLAKVRPKMDYGGEVWEANGPQEKRLEAVQTQAACRIFKLNRRTKTHAARGLLRAPTLRLRRQVSRLKYLVKLRTMERGRLAREVVRLPECKAVRGQGRQTRWITGVRKLLEDDEGLMKEYMKLDRTEAANQGVIPRGVDPACTDFDYYPVKCWHKSLRHWAWAQDLKDFSTCASKQRSTLRVMSRAIQEGADRLPAFPLTRAPNRGQNQIRLRLLCGTSALNSTLAHFNPRKDKCPHGCDAAEDAAHFLLRCGTTENLRSDYKEQLRDRCACDVRIGDGGVVNCADFFEALDDDGKVLFMLGGPVDGRTPELDVDQAAKEYVALAYERRSKRLNHESADPLEVDLTQASNKVVGSSQPSVASFFSTPPPARPAARESAGNNKVPSPRSFLAFRDSALRVNARPNRSSDAVFEFEPGVDSITQQLRNAH